MCNVSPDCDYSHILMRWGNCLRPQADAPCVTMVTERSCRNVYTDHSGQRMPTIFIHHSPTAPSDGFRYLLTDGMPFIKLFDRT